MDGSPDLGMGVTFDNFQASGTFIWERESLKMAVKAGVMDVAVARNMWLNIPSGSVAVCNLCPASKSCTSSCVQDTEVRDGMSVAMGVEADWLA